jgi:ribosomal protein S12 methylthiotransferase accessory factor YcaO
MNKIPTEDHIKEVEQDDRIIQFDAGEELPRATKEEKMRATELLEGNMGEGKAEVVKAIAKAEGIPIHSIGLPDLDEESKRSDRFFGMRLESQQTILRIRSW